MQNWIYYLITFLLPYSTTAICKMQSSSNSPNNAKPSNYVFRIVWPILYFLIATSWALNKRHGANYEIDALYLVNILLGCYWIYSYSSSCKNDQKQALYTLLVMLITAIIMAFLSFQYLNMSAVLLVPYIVWLGFALLLNYTTVQKMNN